MRPWPSLLISHLDRRATARAAGSKAWTITAPHVHVIHT
jgi:hypothetical protein